MSQIIVVLLTTTRLYHVSELKSDGNKF